MRSKRFLLVVSALTVFVLAQIRIPVAFAAVPKYEKILGSGQDLTTLTYNGSHTVAEGFAY